MHISKFRIQNFKSFEDVTFHFNEKVNLLTGVNNSGKTTVLEAISLWQECYAKLVRQTGKKDGTLEKGAFTLRPTNLFYCSFDDIVSVRSPQYADIFRNLDASQGAKIILTATLNNQGKDLDISISITVAKGELYQIALENKEEFDTKTFNDNTFIRNPANAIVTLFASPVAYIAAHEERQHILKIEELKFTHQSQRVMRNRLELLQQRANELGNPYQSFCDQLSLILFGNVKEVSFEFPDNTKLPMKTLIKIGIETAKDISLVGSGTLQIIEILLSVYERKSELSIILLDEPDSHIHRQLQKRLLNVLSQVDNSQVFMTSHNEALIRDADVNWIFHLEQNAKRKEPYLPIQRQRTVDAKGLMSYATAPIIQELSGTGSGLDFINALEADILFMVEGINDALRIQKILSLKINDLKKYAFWVLGSVDEVFDKILYYKTIFEQIKNEKSLWEKAVLIIDKDYMTDIQREKLIAKFQQNKNLSLNKFHIWRSYHFESVLFSDLDKLALILERYIRAKMPLADTSNLKQVLIDEMNKLVDEFKEKGKEANLKTYEDEVKQQLLPRRVKLDDAKMNCKGVIEHDDFTKVINNYLYSSTTITDIHKLMNKDCCEKVLKAVFSTYGIDFAMEGTSEQHNFNTLFATITSSTIYQDWEFITKL